MQTRVTKIGYYGHEIYHYLVKGDYIYEFLYDKGEERDENFLGFIRYIRTVMDFRDEYEMINNLDLELESYVRNHMRNLDITDIRVFATPVKRPLYFIKRQLHRAWNLYFKGKKSLAVAITDKMRDRLEKEFGIYPVDPEFFSHY